MTPTPPSTNSSTGARSPEEQFRVVRKRNRVPLSCYPCRTRKYVHTTSTDHFSALGCANMTCSQIVSIRQVVPSLWLFRTDFIIGSVIEIIPVVIARGVKAWIHRLVPMQPHLLEKRGRIKKIQAQMPCKIGSIDWKVWFCH